MCSYCLIFLLCFSCIYPFLFAIDVVEERKNGANGRGGGPEEGSEEDCGTMHT